MTRQPSILARVISASAESLAQRLQVPAANRQAFVDTAEAVLAAQWSTLFGGEIVRVRFYAPKESQHQREQRRQRIVAALQAGEAPRAIAKREGVTREWVYRLAKVTAAGMERSQPPA
jgi:Mor family transcriptional regulator